MDDLEFLSCLFKCLDYRFAPPFPVFVVLGIEPRGLVHAWQVLCHLGFNSIPKLYNYVCTLCMCVFMWLYACVHACTHPHVHVGAGGQHGVLFHPFPSYFLRQNFSHSTWVSLIWLGCLAHPVSFQGSFSYRCVHFCIQLLHPC